MTMTPDPATVLSARSLRKVFGAGPTRVEALRGIDVDVARGEFVAVTGSSGSGKSTLLHLFAGLEPPTSGTVHVDGVDLGVLSDDQRAVLRITKIGMVFQSFNLLDTLSAEENVALPLAIARRSTAEARRRAESLLALVGLAERARHRPGELSGGEQQRVAVARALALEPRVLLADEPTGNLDSRSADSIVALLRGLVEEYRQTILLVTHNLELARRADRIVALRDGRVVEAAGRGHESLGVQPPRDAA
jgi:putative ABC transport system ATP-binding protein